jgi:uncharacterized protein
MLHAGEALVPHGDLRGALARRALYPGPVVTKRDAQKVGMLNEIIDQRSGALEQRIQDVALMEGTSSDFPHAADDLAATTYLDVPVDLELISGVGTVDRAHGYAGGLRDLLDASIRETELSEDTFRRDPYDCPIGVSARRAERFTLRAANRHQRRLAIPPLERQFPKFEKGKVCIPPVWSRSAVKARTRRTVGLRPRGRAERVVHLVLRTVANELTRVGYALLRVEDIAARSGVNKTTIYRRWPTKPELVAAALAEVAAKAAPTDTGTLRGDLRESLLEVLAQGDQPLGRGLMRLLQSDRTVPEVDALAHRLRDEQHQRRVALVERGIARGELRADIDPHLVVDLVTAPVLRRVFTFGDAVDEDYIDRVLDVVLAGARGRALRAPRADVTSRRPGSRMNPTAPRFRRSWRRVRSWVLAIGLFSATAAATARAVTSWPGGVYEPPPPSYAMAVVSAIPVMMDDGVVLFANVGYPADPVSGQRAPGAFPVLLTQNPYVGGDEPDAFFVSRGYIFATVDVRGTGRSEAPRNAPLPNLQFSARDARDGVELVSWAAHRLDGSNGVVGLTGRSYLGINQIFTAAAVGPDSPVKAILPACASTGYETYFAGGIPSQITGLFGLAGFILGPKHLMENVAAGQALSAEIAASGPRAYNGAYWQERTTANVAADVVRNGIPALLWTGWFPPDGPGAIELYSIFQNTWRHRRPFAPMRPRQRATGRYQIIVGAWNHAEGLDKTIELEWYDTWLKGVPTGIADTATPMNLFEIGASRWVNAATYPLVARSTRLYLGAEGTLVRRRGRTSANDTLAWGPPEMTGTTLRYTSAPFGKATTIAGPMAATIYAASSNTNLELIATLEDVAQDGTATQITRGVLLGSFRALDRSRSWIDARKLLVHAVHPFDVEQPVPPNSVRRYDIGLDPTLWRIAAGNALRLVLSTQATASDCGVSLTLTKAQPCFYTDAQRAALPGGVYQIERGRPHASVINVPLVSPEALATAASDVTPTSNGLTEPLDWDSGG